MQYNATLGDPYAEIDVESLFATLDDLAERGSNTLAPFVAAWSQPVAAAAAPSRDAQVDEVVTQLEADLENKLKDAQRVIESIENLLHGPSGPELLGGPPVEGGPVEVAGLIDGAQIRRCPAGEDVGAAAEG